MRPRSDEPALLILKMRKLDLEHAFAGVGATAEDLKNESGPVDNLGIPSAFEIALLDGCELRVDDDEVSLPLLDFAGDFGDLARANESCRSRFGKWRDQLSGDLNLNRLGELNSLLKTGCGVPFAGLAPLGLDLYDYRSRSGPPFDLETGPLSRATAVSLHLP